MQNVSVKKPFIKKNDEKMTLLSAINNYTINKNTSVLYSFSPFMSMNTVVSVERIYENTDERFQLLEFYYRK